MSVMLDFAGALEVLATWEGKRVTVRSYVRPWREMIPHAHTAMHGRLGPAQMGHAHGAGLRSSLTTFAIGPARPGDSPRNGFMLRSDEFVRAIQASRSQIDVECSDGYHVQIDLD